MAYDYSDIELTLIGPKNYLCVDWGKADSMSLKDTADENVRFISLQFVRSRVWNLLSKGDWRVIGLVKLLKKIKPDLVYMIGTEVSDVTFQVAWAKKRFMPDMKIALFTMRGLNMPLHNLIYRLRWNFVRRFIDAFFCHYPHCTEVLRSQGQVQRPIYMQTQVGVPVDIFTPDITKRKRIREQLGVKDDEYLFGVLGRMDLRKGLLDVLAALPEKAKCKLVMIGDGPDQKRVEEVIQQRGLSERVVLVGRVEYPYAVAEHINGLDCFVAMSKTSSEYIDTFSLSLAQCMATAVPVIVSDSGGLPYQVGKEGIVVKEGDIQGLREAMEFVSSHPDEGRRMGADLQKRVSHAFSVAHLNRCFYYTVQDIFNNVVNVKHIDQQDFSFPSSVG